MDSEPDKQLLSLSFDELTKAVQKFGQPVYRARQIFSALHQRRIADISAITTLPLTFRNELVAAGYWVGLPKLHSRFTSVDGTVRYLFGFPDGQTVETVWMPDG